MIEQILISLIIIVTLGFFLWGKWRYDIVGILALFAAVIGGLLSVEEMFQGFIHPVVILIIAVLIISKGLVNSGAVDIVARHLKFAGTHPLVQLGILVVFTTFMSAFINSLGALAFSIPIAVRMAKQSKTSLSLFLMPLAFASHFGGNLTLIGSASNIIVSEFRGGKIEPFGFFDFSLAAIPIALVSIAFVVIFGWRLIPRRREFHSKGELSEDYITEVKIPEDSPAEAKTIKELQEFSKEHFSVITLIRQGQYIPDPSPFIALQKDDILVIETDTESLESIITTAKLELVHKKPLIEEEKDIKHLEINEVAISKYSSLVGETAKSLDFYRNYRVNLLALRRSGGKIKKRLGDVYFKPGDVLIIQGHGDQLTRFIKIFDLLSLKERDFHFAGERKTAFMISGIFLLAIFASAIGLFPTHIIFAAAAIIIVAAGLVPPKKMYSSIDFSMIVLLAVMIQLGSVFYQTGAASSLAGFLFSFDSLTPQVALTIVFIASIWLSDVLSNVTVAVLLAPVAFSLAQQLGVSPDPFLMAVAIGSGSSYLTPIGHQSNVFVMGIGGYRFSDYWRLGLPLEIITFVVGLFSIFKFWPF